MVRIVSSVIVGGNDAKSREMLGGADVLGGITEGEATPEATEVCASSCTAGPTKSMMQALWGRAGLSADVLRSLLHKFTCVGDLSLR